MSDPIEPTFERERYRRLRLKSKLDLMRVDEELEEMSFLVQEASEYAAKANEVREQAKTALEIGKATIADSLRAEPQASGKPPSESMVESRIPLSNVYLIKQAELSQARLDASLWQSQVDALRTKSSSIRAAADLITSGYMTTNFIQDKRRMEIRRGPSG